MHERERYIYAEKGGNPFLHMLRDAMHVLLLVKDRPFKGLDLGGVCARERELELDHVDGYLFTGPQSCPTLDCLTA